MVWYIVHFTERSDHVRAMHHHSDPWWVIGLGRERKGLWRTLGLGEDGEAEGPDVEEAEPDGGEAEGAHKHQPPPQTLHPPSLSPSHTHALSLYMSLLVFLWGDSSNRWWVSSEKGSIEWSSILTIRHQQDGDGSPHLFIWKTQLGGRI